MAAYIPEEEEPETDLLQSLAELAQNMQTALMSMNEKMRSISPEEMMEDFKTQAQAYVEKLETVRLTVVEEAQKHAHVFDDVVKAVNEKITEAGKIVEQQNPEIIGEVKKIKENVEMRVLQPLMSKAANLRSEIEAQRRPIQDKIGDMVGDMQFMAIESLKKINSELEKIEMN